MTSLHHQTAGGPLFQAVLPRTAAAGCHAAVADWVAGDFLLLYCTCAHSDHLLSPVLTAGGVVVPCLTRLVFGICYLNIWHQIAENLVFENRNSRFLN